MEYSEELVFKSQSSTIKSSDYDINDFLGSIKQGVFQKTLKYQRYLKQHSQIFSWLLGELDEKPLIISDLIAQGILNLINMITIFIELSEKDMLKSESVPIFELMLEILISIANTTSEMRCNLVLQFADPLVNCMLKECMPFFIRLQALKYSNLLFENCPSSVKEILNLKAEHQNNLKNIIKLISTIGDYEFQVAVVEYLFRSISMKRRSKAISNLSDPKIFSFINSINDETFERDCRRCLNAFNSNQGIYQSVFSIPCSDISFGNLKLSMPKDESYKHFWVDFNSTSQRITFYCEQINADEDFDFDDDVWETVNICKEDVMEILTEVSNTEDLSIVFLFFPSQKEILPGYTLKKDSVMKMAFQDKEAVFKAVQEIFSNPKCSVAQISIPVNDGYKADSHHQIDVKKNRYEQSNILNESFSSSHTKSSRKCSIPSDAMTPFLLKQEPQTKALNMNTSKPAKGFTNITKTNAVNASQSSKNADKRKTNSPKVQSKHEVFTKRNSQELKKKDENKTTVTQPNNSLASNCPKTKLTTTKSTQMLSLSAKKPPKKQSLKTDEKPPTTRRSTRFSTKCQDPSPSLGKDAPLKSPVKNTPKQLHSKSRDNNMMISQDSNSDFVIASTAKNADNKNKNAALPPSKADERIKPVISTPLLDIPNISYSKKKREKERTPNTRSNSVLTSMETTKANLDQTDISISQFGNNKSQTAAAKNTSNKTRLRSFDNLNFLPEKYPLHKDNPRKRKTESKSTLCPTAVQLKNSSNISQLNSQSTPNIKETQQEKPESKTTSCFPEPNITLLNTQSILNIKETQQDCTHEEDNIIIPESAPLKPSIINKSANQYVPTFDSGVASSADSLNTKITTVMKKTVKNVSPTTKDKRSTSHIYHSIIQKNSELKSSNIDKIKEINKSVLKEVTKACESQQAAVEKNSTLLNSTMEKSAVRKPPFYFTSPESVKSPYIKTMDSKYSTITEENLKKFNQQGNKSSVNNLTARIKGFVKSSCETVFKDIHNNDVKQTTKKDELSKNTHPSSPLHTSKTLNVENDKNISPQTTAITSKMNVCDDNSDISSKSALASSNISSPVSERKKSSEFKSQQQKVATPENKVQTPVEDELTVVPKTKRSSSKFETSSKQQTKTQRDFPERFYSNSYNHTPSDKMGSSSPSFKLFEMTPAKAKNHTKTYRKSKKQTDFLHYHDPYNFDSNSDKSSNLGQPTQYKFFKCRQNSQRTALSNYLDTTKKPKPAKESKRMPPAATLKETKQSLNTKYKTTQNPNPAASNQRSKSILNESNIGQSSKTYSNLISSEYLDLNNKQHGGLERNKGSSIKASTCPVNSKKAASKTRPTRKRKPVNYKEIDSSSENQSNENEPVTCSRAKVGLPMKKIRTDKTESPPREKSAYPPREKSAYPPREKSVYPPREKSVSPQREKSAYPPREKSAYPPREKSVYPPREKSVYPPREKSVYPPKEKSVSPVISEHTPCYLKQSFKQNQKSQHKTNQTNKKDSEVQNESIIKINEKKKTPVPSISESQFGSSITQNSEVSWIAAKKHNIEEHDIKKTYSTKKKVSYFGSYPCIPKKLKKPKKSSRKNDKKKSENYQFLQEEEVTIDDIEIARAGSLGFFTDEDHQKLTRTTTELSHNESISKSLVSFNISENFLPTNNVFEIHQYQPNANSTIVTTTKTARGVQSTLNRSSLNDSSRCASRASRVSYASKSSHTSISSTKSQFHIQSDNSPLEERNRIQEKHHKLNFQENLSSYEENPSNNVRLKTSLSSFSHNSPMSNLSNTTLSSKNSKQKQTLIIPKQSTFQRSYFSDSFEDDMTTKVNNPHYLPKKMLKKAVSASSSNESEAIIRKVSEMNSCRYTSETAYSQSTSETSSNDCNNSPSDIKQLVHSLGSDMKKLITAKQANISAITKETQTNTEKAISKIWEKDYNNRNGQFKDFERRVSKEFDRLHKEILSAEECRKTLLMSFQEQLLQSENSRLFQRKCFKRLQLLFSQYQTTTSIDDISKQDSEVEVKGILKAEMNDLQKKFLLEANQQEKQQIRSRLSKILF